MELRTHFSRRRAMVSALLVALALTLLSAAVSSIPADAKPRSDAEEPTTEKVKEDRQQPDRDRPGRPDAEPETDDLGSNVRMLNLRVMLEGALPTGTITSGTLMRTDLRDFPAGNLLPSTDPFPDPGPGQPVDPDVMTSTGGDRIVDWIRVQVLDAADPTIVEAETSAIVEADGDVRSAFDAGLFPQVTLADGAFLIRIVHQSHLSAVSPVVVFNNNVLSYDFTTSATGQPGASHQKEVGAGIYALFAGNADQSTEYTAADINGADKILWSYDNGLFGQYLPTDFDMNGDVNGNDRLTWLPNFGVFGPVFPQPSGGAVINEVEGNPGTPNWIELANPTEVPADLSGYQVQSGSGTYTVPAGTTLDPGRYLVIRETELGFPIVFANGELDLTNASGSIVDTVSWPALPASSLSRCQDRIGWFEQSRMASPAVPNICNQAGGQNYFYEVSGLDLVSYQHTAPNSPRVLWAVEDTGRLTRLDWGALAPTWSTNLRRVNGSNALDAEGVTISWDDPGQLFVAIERDGSSPRYMVLRYSVDTQPGVTLRANFEWDLTATLHAQPLPGGLSSPWPPNKGPEALTFIHDADLHNAGFWDDSMGQAYDPTDYPGKVGAGLFFVGAEYTGLVYVFALKSDGTHALVSTIDPGLGRVNALDFDEVTGQLWVVCDDDCSGGVGQVAMTTDNQGRYQVTQTLAVPAAIANKNIEAFTIGGPTECSSSLRMGFWGEDLGTLSSGIYAGNFTC